MSEIIYLHGKSGLKRVYCLIEKETYKEFGLSKPDEPLADCVHRLIGEKANVKNYCYAFVCFSS